MSSFSALALQPPLGALPARLSNPFDPGPPHPLVLEAAELLQCDLAILPSPQRDDLAKGKLVRLLQGWKAPDANVIALTHQRAGLPARTRHFMQYLQGRFRPAPPWRR